MVTLAVLSISLTVLYQVFSSVARGTHLSADYYRALEIAESRMSLLSTEAGTVGGSSGVIDNYYRWQTSIQIYTPPFDSPLASDSFDRRQQTYLLSVNVSWGDARKHNLELNTIRLASGS